MISKITDFHFLAMVRFKRICALFTRCRVCKVLLVLAKKRGYLHLQKYSSSGYLDADDHQLNSNIIYPMNYELCH